MKKALVTAPPGQPSFTIERTFEATPEKLFAALTQKAKLERWWVGPGYHCAVEHIDARDGGSWKYVLTGSEGQNFVFHGSFHEVSPLRIVQTSEVDNPEERGHVSLEKVELIAVSATQTKLLSTTCFMTVAERDLMIQNGMEGGVNASYYRLDEVLSEEGR